MSKIINWGIIGCGNVTEVKSGPAYKKTKGFNLKAVMRRDPIKVMDYAQRHSVEKYYTNADTLINDPDIDAVYIATPPDTHKYYAMKVAKAGKPCCIEKPITPTYQEALDINDAFSNKNIPLFVAYYRRSLPRFNKVKQWIDNNYIGDIRHISYNLIRPANKADLSKIYNWRTDSKIAPGGYFDDIASHAIDLFIFLLGNIKTVSGISTNQQGLYSAKDAITSNWLHENNITGSGTWNFGSYSYTDNAIIYGNKGTISFSVFQERNIELLSETKKESCFIENPKHIQMYHVENMRNYLMGNAKSHPSTGQTALHTSWVMSEILK